MTICSYETFPSRGFIVGKDGWTRLDFGPVQPWSGRAHVDVLLSVRLEEGVPEANFVQGSPTRGIRGGIVYEGTCSAMVSKNGPM